jgi:hypothetical protein
VAEAQQGPTSIGRCVEDIAAVVVGVVPSNPLALVVVNLCPLAAVTQALDGHQTAQLLHYCFAFAHYHQLRRPAPALPERGCGGAGNVAAASRTGPLRHALLPTAQSVRVSSPPQRSNHFDHRASLTQLRSRSVLSSEQWQLHRPVKPPSRQGLPDQETHTALEQEDPRQLQGRRQLSAPLPPVLPGPC